jgi:hypothetical protein
MFEFAQFGAGEVIALVAVLGGVAIALSAIIMTFWSRVRRSEIEASLKLEMVKQGKSIEEIERLLRASHGPSLDPKQRLAIHAMNMGHSAEEIERLVRALSDSGTPAEALRG